MNSTSSPKTQFNRYDALIAALVALLALACALWFYGGLGRGGADVTAVVTHRGQEVARLDLQQGGSCTVEGQYRLSVTAEGGRVSVTGSDCPTQDCVRTGWISRPGQSIVCLPEQVVVKLVGQKQSGDYDIIIG